MLDERRDGFEDDFEDEDAQKDKYLTFKVAGEFYALEIKDILEIVGIQKITQIPDMPDYVKGVINLRGKIIPVVDVRLRFRLPEMAYHERTCIVVVDLNSSSVGFIVDEVSEVVTMPQANIDPAPQTSKGSKSRFVQGIGRMGDQVKIILSLEKLLKEDELAAFAEVSLSEESL